MNRKMYLLLVTIVLIYMLIIFLNPMRRSEKQIRQGILNMFPSRPTIEDVENVAQESGWGFFASDYKKYANMQGEEIEYISELNFTIGEYRELIFFSTTVYACFLFDTSGNLVDIQVTKGSF